MKSYHLRYLDANGSRHQSLFPFPVTASSMHLRLMHQNMKLKASTIVILWMSSGLLLPSQQRRNFTSFLSGNTGSHLQMDPLSTSTPKLSHQTTSWINMRTSTFDLIQTQRPAFQSWSDWCSGLIPLISQVSELLHFGLSTCTLGTSQSTLVPSLQSLQLIIWHTFLR